MGVCNKCKEKGKKSNRNVTEFEISPMSTCDSCNKQYWVDSGKLVKDD